MVVETPYLFLSKAYLSDLLYSFLPDKKAVAYVAVFLFCIDLGNI